MCIPTFVLAVYHALAYASTHFSGSPLWQQYGQPIHRMLVSRQRYANPKATLTCMCEDMVTCPAAALQRMQRDTFRP